MIVEIMVSYVRHKPLRSCSLVCGYFQKHSYSFVVWPFVHTQTNFEVRVKIFQKTLLYSRQETRVCLVFLRVPFVCCHFVPVC